jgi:hypothetical protein
MTTIDDLVASIGKLDENQRAELTAKLSANAEKKTPLRSLRAASAAVPNKAMITIMMASARRLGVAHLIEMDEPINVDELNRALIGNPAIEDRFRFKSELSQLGMI